MVGLGCQAVTLELHKQKEQTETARLEQRARQLL